MTLRQYIEVAGGWGILASNPKSSAFASLKVGDTLLSIGADSAGGSGFGGWLIPPASSVITNVIEFYSAVAPADLIGYDPVSAWSTTPLVSDTSGYITAYGTVGASVGGAGLIFSAIAGLGGHSKSSSTGIPSVSVTTASVDETIVVAIFDKVAVDGAARAWLAVNGHAPTELSYYRDANWTVYIAVYENTGTAGAKTVGLSGPTGQTYQILAAGLIGRVARTKTVSFDTQLVPAVGIAIVDPSPYELRNNANVAASWIFNDTQTAYRAEIFSDPYGRVRVYDSGLVASGIQSATLATAAALVSNTVYYLRLYAQNGTTSQGQTGLVPFYFGLPTSVNVTGLRATAFPACDPSPSDNPSIVLTWTVPAPTETFLAYEVRRRKRGETTYVPIERITTQIHNNYTDANIVPGQEYEYVVVFYGDAGGTVTKVSAEQATPVRATVRFDWIYIHEVDSQQSEFFRIESLSGTVDVHQDVVIASTWGRASPTAFVGEQFTHAISLPGLDRLRSRPSDWAKFERMLLRQATDGGTLCIRFGLDRELYFVNMLGLSKALAERSWVETTTIQEVAYEESIGYYVHTPGQPA